MVSLYIAGWGRSGFLERPWRNTENESYPVNMSTESGQPWKADRFCSRHHSEQDSSSQRNAVTAMVPAPAHNQEFSKISARKMNWRKTVITVSWRQYHHNRLLAVSSAKAILLNKRDADADHIWIGIANDIWTDGDSIGILLEEENSE